MSLEVVATRSGGIRYIVQLEPKNVEMFKQIVHSYLPTIIVKVVGDYLPPEGAKLPYRIADFKQAGSFAYPLTTHDRLSQHDPISYITGSMAKPMPDEIIAYQMVIAPALPRVASKIRAKLLHGEDPKLHRKWWHYPFIIAFKLLGLIIKIGFTLIELVGEEVSGVYPVSPAATYKPAKVSPITRHKLEAIHAKLDQPLFYVSIRTLVINDYSGTRMQGIVNSLYQFHVPGYQGLIARRIFPRKYVIPFRMHSFAHRLPTLITNTACILSSDEIAGLYHFPYGSKSNTEDVIHSLTTTLPAPLAMKQRSDATNFDVVLGVNHHHGIDTALGLTAKEREKHVYIVGGTGNGKTTMLENAVLQDIENSKGVAFIDPHGDAAKKLLQYIPESRIHDVVYLNPLDIKHPIGLNVLELPEGLDEDELLLEKERVAEAAISVLRKVFADDDANAHRIEAMFRNAIHTAFTVEGATLFTVLKLIRNSEYRNAVVRKLADEMLRDFWREEFGKAVNIRTVMSNVRYFMEHLEKLLLQQSNPASKADYFSVLFDTIPTYHEIKYGTQNPCQLTGMNELFKLKDLELDSLVIPRGIEPLLPG